MKMHITITSGTLAGRTFELESGFLTIGRGATCSIRLDPMSERIASTQHAFVEAKADGYYLTDNKSTNGTLLNGVPVAAAKLRSGDEILFGRNGVSARVRIDDAPGPASRAHAIPKPESFREFEVEQFNRTVAREPSNIHSSLVNFGLGSVAGTKDAEPGRDRKHLGVVIGTMSIVFLSLVVILLISTVLSPTADGEMTLNIAGIAFALAASVVAFIPAVIYVFPLVWLDRYDPEPLWLLALSFAWGALVAVLVSFTVNSSVGYLALKITGDPEKALFISAVISAPVFEEASKGCGLLILLIFFRRYFDDILDGIVFAGVIALGFATVENVLYYGRAIGATGLDGLVLLFVLRGILSPFAHVTFTSMTGIGCGISRESHNKFVRILLPAIGYAGAVTLHAVWNGMAFFSVPLVKRLDIGWICEKIGLVDDAEPLCDFLISYAVLEVPLFAVFIAFALYVMWRQNRILTDMLAIDIARGLIPAEHAATATSAFRSSGWVIGGLFNGKFKARSSYVRAIGKLGLSYWHIQRATAAQGHTGSFQQNPLLREAVLKWRDQV